MEYFHSILSSYYGYVRMRGIIISLLVVLLISNIIYIKRKNNSVALVIKFLAPFSSFLVTFWIINHFRVIVVDIYGQSVVFRENNVSRINEAMIFTYGLLNQELIIAIASFILLLFSFFVIHNNFKKKESQH